MHISPICLFVFNRLNETIKTVEYLKKNKYANQSVLYIFSDGSNKKIDATKVAAVRDYIKTIDGFKKIIIFESPYNKGLANSIIDGVNHVLQNHKTVIVIEDDLITSPIFLEYMNSALLFYQKNNSISTICGFSHDLPILKNFEHDIYYSYRPSSWGWATWNDRWSCMIWNNNFYWKFIYNPFYWHRMLRGGSDIIQMLFNQLIGKIDSWAIRWTVSQLVRSKYSVFPKFSLVENNGININATNTKYSLRFKANLEPNVFKKFKFPKNLKINKNIQRQFLKKYSIIARFKDKLI
jgi:hypothetical protein